MFERTIEISPAQYFAKTINIQGNFALTDLYTEMIDVNTGEVLVQFQPIALEPVAELPEPWKGYAAPEELETVEELYLIGKHVEQFYAPRYDQMDWYQEALRRDPYDIRTNTAVGNNYLKNGEYHTAKDYFARAIKRLTANYTRPSDSEALYLQGLTLKALGLFDEATDTLYRDSWNFAYHSAAYYELAQISVMHGDFNRALYQVNESLSTNTRNNRAAGLKAAIQRRMGDYEGAITTLETIIDADPLDFRIRNEYYLIAKESGDQQKAAELKSSRNMLMRDFDENYLELAYGYLMDGLLAEAEESLKRYHGNNPLFDYYLGTIYTRYGNNTAALGHFQAAASQPVDYIFPHRLKTVDVLKTALKHNPDDGKAYYYIGNILFDKQPAYAIENWENTIQHQPELAIA